MQGAIQVLCFFNYNSQSFICTSAGPAHCIETSATESGAPAEIVATLRKAKYPALPSQYTFHPIAVETHGPVNETAITLLCELDSCITPQLLFLFQRLSVCVQRFNAVQPRDRFQWIKPINGHSGYFCYS